MSGNGPQPRPTHSLNLLASPAARWATLLALLALAVRLPGLGRPLVGNFATKNAVYAMIARNWAEGRAPLWLPTVDVLADGQRSWHLTEYPVSAALSAGLWRLCGGSLDFWGRLTSALFSAAATALLYLLVLRGHGPRPALAAALVFTLAPVSVLYGQCFMLEASVACGAVATPYALERGLHGRAAWLAVAAVCWGLLLLTKIYMLALVLLWAAVGRRALRAGVPGRKVVWSAAALAIAVLPAALWYAVAYSLGDPDGPYAARVFYGVRQSAAVHHWPPSVLGEAGFYVRLAGDLATVALTPVGFVLAGAGFWHPAWRRHAAWLASSALIVVALPLKFTALNYYFLVVIPPLCVLAGLGWEECARRFQPRRWMVGLVVGAGVLASFRYTVRPAFHTPPEDRGVVAAAAALNRLAAEGEPVVTRHGTTIDLLYYARRPGWTWPPGRAATGEACAAFGRAGARFLAVADDESRLAGSTEFSDWECRASGEGYRVYRLPEAAPNDAAD